MNIPFDSPQPLRFSPVIPGSPRYSPVPPAVPTESFHQTSAAWRAFDRTPALADLPKGLDLWWRRALGARARWRARPGRWLARARRIVRREEEETVAALADSKLKEEAARLAEAFRRERETEAEVDRACALIREGAKRTLGFRHHAVQVAGGLALWDGCVAEMATGEGKTLTATIPAILAGWRGRGCHVVTVNDYLAARDAEEMGVLYRFFGVASASVDPDDDTPARRKAYAADVTYLTNKEVAADFLRDRLALGRAGGLPPRLLDEIVAAHPAFAGHGRGHGHGHGPGQGIEELRQRGLEYAIVDEADSVLVDEAVTPLIISGDGPESENTERFAQARRLAECLEDKRDYRVDHKYKEIRLTRPGKERLAELARPLGGFWRSRRRAEEMVNQALVARYFFLRGGEYIVDDGKVVIVDEATGRLMPDRTWRDGLHQAVEAKEGVEVTPPKATFARLSFQRFFRLYRKLAGMTGTGEEARGEFWQIYGLPVAAIPTHRPCRRVMASPRVFATGEEKWTAVAEEIKRLHATGRPVLVGTRSVEASENLSERLKAEGLEHQVLNAVFHREEAAIVAHAGEAGRITVATNMAGRGTDIKLAAGVSERGGLQVLATERHLTRRVDRQLFGRGARQGDPGGAQMFVALDDELPRRFAKHSAALARRLWPLLPPSRRARWLHPLFNRAERQAERQALAQRKGVLRADTWLKETLGFAGREW